MFLWIILQFFHSYCLNLISTRSELNKVIHLINYKMYWIEFTSFMIELLDYYWTSRPEFIEFNLVLKLEFINDNVCRNIAECVISMLSRSDDAISRTGSIRCSRCYRNRDRPAVMALSVFRFRVTANRAMSAKLPCSTEELSTSDSSEAKDNSNRRKWSNWNKTSKP